MVIVAVGVAIAVPRIQKLDRDNNATFLFGQNTTLLISRYTQNLNNVCYVKYRGGALDGVDNEHALFSAMHPNAKCIPIGTTGGAARMLAVKLNYTIPFDLGPLDFISLLYRELKISPIEQRQG